LDVGSELTVEKFHLVSFFMNEQDNIPIHTKHDKIANITDKGQTMHLYSLFNKYQIQTSETVCNYKKPPPYIDILRLAHPCRNSSSTTLYH
jgi:hypothetical protein